TRVSAPTRPHRGELREIARRAMRERGLEPDFSPTVLAETGAITKPAEDRDPAIRDLRGLLWASIDNDDSRDLDQLSVAEPAGAAARRRGPRPRRAAPASRSGRAGDEGAAPSPRRAEPRDARAPGGVRR